MNNKETDYQDINSHAETTSTSVCLTQWYRNVTSEHTGVKAIIIKDTQDI